MFEIDNLQLIVIGVIAVLLFGDRLPSMMRSLGRGLRKLNESVREVQDDVNRHTKP
jgi:sec-independent protein translocase protein TatA